MKYDNHRLTPLLVRDHLRKTILALMGFYSLKVDIQIGLLTDLKISEIISFYNEEAGDDSGAKRKILLLKQSRGKFNYSGSRISLLLDSDIEVNFKILEIGDWDLSNTYEKILSEEIIFERNSKKILFFWDHGAAFSIFKTEPLVVEHNFQLMTENQASFDYNPFFSDLNINVKLNNNHWRNRKEKIKDLISETDFFQEAPKDPFSLSMDELGESLKKSNFKPNVIVLANCFMMTADTLFALHNMADYLVAPQSAIPFNIFDWEKILKGLGMENCDSSQKGADLFIQSIAESKLIMGISNPENPNEPIKDRIAIFGWDLDFLERSNFWESFEKCILLWIHKIKNENEFSKIIDARDRLGTMNALMDSYELPYYWVDLFSLINFISESINLMDDEKLMNSNIIHIMKGFHMKNLSYTGKMAANDFYSCHGLAVIFPTYASTFNIPQIKYYYNTFGNNPHRNSFAKQLSWDNFLFLIFKMY